MQAESDSIWAEIEEREHADQERKRDKLLDSAGSCNLQLYEDTGTTCT